MFSWLRQHPAAEDVDNTTQQQEAEAGKTLAAIFKPSHAAVREAPDTHGDLLRSGVRLFKDDECPSSATTTTTHTSTGDMQEKKKSASSSRKQNGEVGDVLDMFSLPPSPILGYALREEGLVEELVRPPRVLTIQELRSLIVELSSVEQRARYNVDIQLPQQIHNRGRRSLELIVSPCLYMCGLYLLLWKTPRLYFGVTPRSSVVFTRILSLMRWHVPEVERERMARSHRWVFQATNARVTLSFLAGCAVTAIAVVTQPTLDVVDTGPDVELGKESVGFQKHSEAALRWLWLVYYHHPAYRSQAIGKLPQILQSTTARS